MIYDLYKLISPYVIISPCCLLTNSAVRDEQQLKFAIKGLSKEFGFMPSWLLPATQSFTTFPLFESVWRVIWDVARCAVWWWRNKTPNSNSTRTPRSHDPTHSPASSLHPLPPWPLTCHLDHLLYYEMYIKMLRLLILARWARLTVLGT